VTGAKRLAARLACLAALLGLWQAFVATGIVSSDAVAEPTQTAGALGSLVLSSDFWSSVWQTVQTWGFGLLLVLAVAIPAGLVLGASDLTYRLFRVTIDFLRTIPPVALIPLALLLYGATDRMALMLVVFGSIWPVLLQSMYGVLQVDPACRDAAAAYRLRRRDVVLRVVLPSAAPFVATGVRVAATISLLLAVGAEFLGGAPGVGASIALAQQAQQIPRMYAYVVVGAALGVAVNLLMIELERKVLSWHPAYRPAAAR
jgi:ABC-type nitrate/sulfonate/bicarbonate transport system permease component